MHEVSLAANIVEIASRHAADQGCRRVVAVTVRIGRLACVHEDALRSSFELLRENTPLVDAELHVVTVPVRVWCPTCGTERELPGIQRFVCPDCGAPTGDIRAGRELDLESIDLAEAADA